MLAPASCPRARRTRPPGGQQRQELRLLRRAGVPPMAALNLLFEGDDRAAWREMLRREQVFNIVELDAMQFPERQEASFYDELAKLRPEHEDTVSRLGGDEFIIMMPETTKKTAIDIAERLRKAIQSNTFLQDKGMKVKFTASFGLATFPEDAETKDELIRIADERMYKVKNSSRNSVAST